MDDHYNIQISIQKVSKEEPAPAVHRGFANPPVKGEPKRIVTDVLSVKVTAPSLSLAVRKAVNVLNTSLIEPEE